MGIGEFDALSKSYGLATALLIFAVLGLSRAVWTLYQENQLLHERLEGLTSRRAEVLEAVLARVGGDQRTDHSDSREDLRAPLP